MYEPGDPSGSTKEMFPTEILIHLPKSVCTRMLIIYKTIKSETS